MKKPKLSISPIKHIHSMLPKNIILFDAIETIFNEKNNIRLMYKNILVFDKSKFEKHHLIKKNKIDGIINFFSQEETSFLKTSKKNYIIQIEPCEERKSLKLFFPKTYLKQKLAIEKKYKSFRKRRTKEVELEKKYSLLKCAEENNKSLILLKIEYESLIQKYFKTKFIKYLEEQLEVFNIIYKQYVLWFHKNNLSHAGRTNQFLTPWNGNKKEFILFVNNEYQKDLQEITSVRKYSSFANCLKVNYNSYVFENGWKFRSVIELYKKLRKDDVF